MSTLDRQKAILRAQEWMTKWPLFLDTETTGLDHTAEACEIAVLDAMEVVVFYSLVKPTHSIPTEAIQLHGITNKMVEDAPTFGMIAQNLWEKLDGHLVIAYNANFDDRIIAQSRHAARVTSLAAPQTWQGWAWGCAMQLYAHYRGEWDAHRHTYRWYTLGNAAQQCGIVLPDLHRAQADAEICRRIILHIAKTKA